MIREAPAWEGRSRYGEWVEREPLWDGTPQWEYVPPEPFTFLSILQRLDLHRAQAAKIAWLEDALMPRASA